jgi:CBS domain-containing protein
MPQVAAENWLPCRLGGVSAASLVRRSLTRLLGSSSVPAASAWNRHSERSDMTQTIREVMTTDPLTMPGSSPLSEAADISAAPANT